MKEFHILRGPVDTEKSNLQKEKDNRVTFEVDPAANRVEIGKAVEMAFNVKVSAVRTINVKGKIKRRGKIIGKRRDWKKATVTLMPGHRINFFEGA